MIKEVCFFISGVPGNSGTPGEILFVFENKIAEAVGVVQIAAIPDAVDVFGFTGAFGADLAVIVRCMKFPIRQSDSG
jgi:hypothetical protein